MAQRHCAGISLYPFYIHRFYCEALVVKLKIIQMIAVSTALLVGASLYLNLNSSAYTQIAAWQTTRPDDAIALETIAAQPTAQWFGDWNSDITTAVDDYVTSAHGQGTIPTLVLYNIPNRDCGNYSSGGAEASEYTSWVQDFSDGIANRQAVVIVEPDALALDCLYDTSYGLIGEAVTILKAQPKTVVYLDAGHPNWIKPRIMAERLRTANVAAADGFALNVSNFYKTKRNLKYGRNISNRLGGAHFIIDTSRNGNGWNGEWCNPTDRAIGHVPTTRTGHHLADAYLWVKPPGESDGYCNGGPAAGTWWPEYALDLVS